MLVVSSTQSLKGVCVARFPYSQMIISNSVHQHLPSSKMFQLWVHAWLPWRCGGFLPQRQLEVSPHRFVCPWGPWGQQAPQWEWLEADVVQAWSGPKCVVNWWASGDLAISMPPDQQLETAVWAEPGATISPAVLGSCCPSHFAACPCLQRKEELCWL